MSRTVPGDTVRLNSGKGQRKFKSPVEMLANTVAHMQRDLDILRDEHHALKSTTAPQVMCRMCRTCSDCVVAAKVR